MNYKSMKLLLGLCFLCILGFVMYMNCPPYDVTVSVQYQEYLESIRTHNINGNGEQDPDCLFSNKTKSWLTDPGSPLMRLVTYKPNGKLLHCRIPKSMTTVIELIFGFIHNENNCENLTTGFQMSNAPKQFKICQKGVKSVSPGVILDHPSGVANLNISLFSSHSYFYCLDYTVFAVAREPIKRLLSGWLDKCLFRINRKSKVFSILLKT